MGQREQAWMFSYDTQRKLRISRGNLAAFDMQNGHLAIVMPAFRKHHPGSKVCA